VAACAALVHRVIISAPGVHVLVAGREGLGVPGERVVTVRSLSFPPRRTKHERRVLEACEAVRLFVAIGARSLAVKPLSAIDL
jgi:predicted ATPase